MSTWGDWTDDTLVYRDEETAQKRVDKLREVGIWPGIIRLADGRCVLAFNPPGSKGVLLDSHGYASGARSR